MNVCDLLAILPFYLERIVILIAGDDADYPIFRTARLIRLFRIFKFMRYSTGMQLMAKAIMNSLQALFLLAFFLSIGVVLFSSMVHYIEKLSCPTRSVLQGNLAGGQDGIQTEMDVYLEQCKSELYGHYSDFGLCCDAFDMPLDFPSIPHGFWWAMVTMTTVGFGEIYPKTTAGKMVAVMAMACGILCIALPVAIIGRKFEEAYFVHITSKKCAHDFHNDDNDLELMAKRVREMTFPNPLLSLAARELACDFEQLGMLQSGIATMHSRELARQRDCALRFESLLGSLKNFADSADMRRVMQMEPQEG